ncbi:hypothetical protein Mapa_006129 [Marchantia paleacea]|nr:hypothetical protein Mapa_006129 [Marchantia paleacea]
MEEHGDRASDHAIERGPPGGTITPGLQAEIGFQESLVDGEGIVTARNLMTVHHIASPIAGFRTLRAENSSNAPIQLRSRSPHVSHEIIPLGPLHFQDPAPQSLRRGRVKSSRVRNRLLVLGCGLPLHHEVGRVVNILAVDESGSPVFLQAEIPARPAEQHKMIPTLVLVPILMRIFVHPLHNLGSEIGPLVHCARQIGLLVQHEQSVDTRVVGDEECVGPGWIQSATRIRLHARMKDHLQHVGICVVPVLVPLPFVLGSIQVAKAIAPVLKAAAEIQPCHEPFSAHSLVEVKVDVELGRKLIHVHSPTPTNGIRIFYLLGIDGIGHYERRLQALEGQVATVHRVETCANENYESNGEQGYPEVQFR